MQLLERQADVLDGSRDLETIHSLPGFPVFMGCVDHPASEDLVADQTWQISRGTGVLQLKYLIPLEILYQAQHAGAIGKIWMDHHAAFARFIGEAKPRSLLELGGAHGILSKLYAELGDSTWTILEPNPAPVEGVTARFIRGFFDERFKPDAPIDAVVHSHVFEHIYEPDQFMGNLSRLLPEGKDLIFTLPNMEAMLERKYTNCINFEHTVFLTEPYIGYLLAKHGFRLLRKEYFLEDHSIFYHAVRDASTTPVKLAAGLYERNKALYLDYVGYHETLIEEVNRELASSASAVYLFGAHVFSQYLIAYGLDTKRIVSILDNDPKKQGKRLYGTSLLVNSPRVLADAKDPVVILKAGVYNEEIRQDILQNINPKTRFV